MPLNWNDPVSIITASNFELQGTFGTLAHMNSLQEVARLIFDFDTDVIGYRLIVTVFDFGGQVTR